jgi:hypothetical protein
MLPAASAGILGSIKSKIMNLYNRLYKTSLSGRLSVMVFYNVYILAKMSLQIQRHDF